MAKSAAWISVPVTLCAHCLAASQTLRIFQSIAGDYDDCCLPSSTCAVMFHPVPPWHPSMPARRSPATMAGSCKISSPEPSKKENGLKNVGKTKPGQLRVVFRLEGLKMLEVSERFWKVWAFISSMRRLPVLTPSWLICAHRFINVITTT